MLDTDSDLLSSAGRQLDIQMKEVSFILKKCKRDTFMFGNLRLA